MSTKIEYRHYHLHHHSHKININKQLKKKAITHSPRQISYHLTQLLFLRFWAKLHGDL